MPTRLLKAEHFKHGQAYPAEINAIIAEVLSQEELVDLSSHFLMMVAESAHREASTAPEVLHALKSSFRVLTSQDSHIKSLLDVIDVIMTNGFAGNDIEVNVDRVNKRINYTILR